MSYWIKFKLLRRWVIMRHDQFKRLDTQDSQLERVELMPFAAPRMSFLFDFEVKSVDHSNVVLG